MQDRVERALRNPGFAYEREVSLSKKSRVDFRVGNTLVESKAPGFSKTSMLRQIKRYKKDYPATDCIIIVTPDPIRNFKIGGVPVYAVNVSNNSLLIEGLS